VTPDQVDRLRLIRTPRIGPVTFAQLLRRFGSAGRAIAALPDLARAGGGGAPQVPPASAIERELARAAALGARHLLIGDALYPPLLAATDTAPPALFVRGNLALLDRPTVAIVGARNASAAACRFARELAVGLAQAGCLVVSGLARGIDTAAHTGAMAAPGGATVGVIASGIDIAFPPENAALQETIARDHLLIAEQLPGAEPLARHFPHRNRIIAGLSLATVVVEAAPRSGSLITARLAAEMGREVLAVPGSPLDARAQGCNQLIRDGATLIQSAADVLEAIRPIGSDGVVRSPGVAFTPPPAQPHDADDRDRTAVTALLSVAPVAVDEIIRQSRLSNAVVQTVLLELDLAGRLGRHAGGRVSLA